MLNYSDAIFRGDAGGMFVYHIQLLSRNKSFFEVVPIEKRKKIYKKWIFSNICPLEQNLMLFHAMIFVFVKNRQKN